MSEVKRSEAILNSAFWILHLIKHASLDEERRKIKNSHDGTLLKRKRPSEFFCFSMDFAKMRGIRTKEIIYALKTR